MTVVLSDITFRQTPLNFTDCGTIRLFNCSVQDAPTAFSVNMKKRTRLEIGIEASSLFQNNSRCIEILLFKNPMREVHFLKIDVKDTHFRENGFHGLSTARDVISIATSDQKLPGVSHIDISCYNITSFANNGSFLNLNDKTALTSEMYDKIKIMNNCLTIDSATNITCNVDSMYASSARKTRVTFNDFNCVNNERKGRVRCINIRADEAEVIITKSYFAKHYLREKNGAGLFLETQKGASLAIINTEFAQSGAVRGGALFVDNKREALWLNLSNVNFTHCTAQKEACAVSIGLSKHQSKYDLYGSFRNVHLRNCQNGKHGKPCGGVCLLMKSGNVTIEESTFVKNLNARSGLLFVGNTGGKVDVRISGTAFIDNHAARKRSAVIRMAALRANAGTVTMTNVSMLRNTRHAMMISPKYKIKLANVTVVLSMSALLLVNTWHSPNVYPVNLFVYNSSFLDNVHDMQLTFQYPTSIHVSIVNTKFIASNTTKEHNARGSAIRCVIPPKDSAKISSTFIELDEVTFDSRPSSSFAFFFKGRKSLRIRRSVFRNCVTFRREHWFIKGSSYHSETCSGAISILNIPDHEEKSGCLSRRASPYTYPVWNYDSHVTFEDTLFLGNAGCLAGAVYISNGNTTFQNCTFKDNFAANFSGQVYSAFGTGRVEFRNCTFLTTQTNITTANGTTFKRASFLYAESEGPIRFRSTNMSLAVGERNFSPVLEINNGGYVDIDQYSTIQCSVGSRLWFENASHFRGSKDENRTFCRLNVTALKFTCKLCPSGYYSLQRGHSRGLHVNHDFTCLPCPFGANCIHTNIAARPNFWGFPSPIKRSSLDFITCPESYCGGSKSDKAAAYNVCLGNRTGYLCGKCVAGFTETVFSPECQKNSKCGNPWFWISTLIFTTGLALFLLVKLSISRLLGKHILCFKENKESHITENTVQADEYSDTGCLKIIFYFYQAADLLIVDSLGSVLRHFPYLQAVAAAFNFHVRIVNRGIGCPFTGLTVVTKEFLLSLVVLVTMADVGIIYFIHFAINLMFRKQKPRLSHYLAVVLEILLLGYERLAETSLKLMHCVAVGSESRLFVDANVKCWQWWQFVLLAYIVVFVVPFIAVLYFGSLKLQDASLTSSNFLTACIFPLPFLVYWLGMHIFKERSRDVSASGQVVNKEILEVLQGPFRPPSDNEQGTLYWESVLIGRRFILLTLHAFLEDSMLRMVCMAGACVIMLVHHMTKNPYRDSMANKGESLSLTTLTIIAIINLAKATLQSSGISPEGPMKRHLERFQWFELSALGFVPMLLFVLAAFAILSQLVRIVKFLTCRIVTCLLQIDIFYRATEDARRPLLDGHRHTHEDSTCGK